MNLESLRKHAGMTQKELAELVHVKQNTVSQWESGKRQIPSSILPVIAQVLGCTIDELFGRAPPGTVIGLKPNDRSGGASTARDSA